jgi:hypothetical protein
MAALDCRGVCWQRGDTVVIRERWRDRLWSAVPHIAVEPGRGHAGDVREQCRRTGARGLARAERKLAALQTCIYRVAEQAIGLAMLHFFTPGSHARVNLGWTSDGTFTGWYVNLERPVTVHDDGLETMDLVLDLHIAPDGRWQWKDREHFDEAVRRGVLEAARGRGCQTAEVDHRAQPSAPREQVARLPAQWGNCAASKRRTSASSVSNSSACISRSGG